MWASLSVVHKYLKQALLIKGALNQALNICILFPGSKTYEKTFQMNAVSELSRGSELCTQPKFNIIECQVKSGKEIIHKDYTYSYIFYDQGMIMKRTNPNKTLSTYSTYDRIQELEEDWWTRRTYNLSWSWAIFTVFRGFPIRRRFVYICL